MVKNCGFKTETEPNRPLASLGGTDIILVGKEYVKSKLLKPGVHCTIELKKPNFEEKHMWQSILEMIVADVYVKKDVKVFGVLTDLNSFWNIFWLDERKEIIIVPLENHKTAFEIIGNQPLKPGFLVCQQ